MKQNDGRLPHANDFFQQVYELVREIPAGRVVSYGQVARLLGKPRGARSVGWAMRALRPNSGVPWQRVVGASGNLSLSGRSGTLQRALLEAEGIQFDGSGTIPMERFRWDPE